MKGVAQAINAFSIEETPSRNAAVLVPLETLEAILKGVQSLQQEVQGIKKKIECMEALEEIYHGPKPQAEDMPHLQDVWANKRKQLEGLPSLVKALEEDLSNLERDVRCKEPKAPGNKSAARIERLKHILKGCGGAATFKQLQKDLDLDPSQFSQLVAKLDKRVFVVSLRPNGKKGEKVLMLRKRINEPLLAV